MRFRIRTMLWGRTELGRTGQNRMGQNRTEQNRNLTSVTISEGITTIGQNAFTE